MSWERDPLWAKARLFFERAFSEERDGPIFGLWCSFGLELLARAALSSVSPTLLAEPDAEHKFLLIALNRGAERTPRKSIGIAQVLNLCRQLFREFTDEDLKVALAIVNRRNEELHSGAAAFEEYAARQWLASFYHACQSLCTVLGEPLTALFGEEEAKAASLMVLQNQNDVKQRVMSSISAYRKVFEGKPEEERLRVKALAEERGNKLATQKHHRVTCPACQCTATVQGTSFGKETVFNRDGEITVRQPVSPTDFACPACELGLHGYAELDVAGLGGQYTRTTTYSPEEYYGLVREEDLEAYVEERLRRGEEYDNE